MEFVMKLAWVIGIFIVLWRYIRHRITRAEMYDRGIYVVTSRDIVYWKRWYTLLSVFLLLFGTWTVLAQIIYQARVEWVGLSLIFWGLFFTNWTAVKGTKPEWGFDDYGIFPAPYYKEVEWSIIECAAWNLDGKDANLTVTYQDPVNHRRVELKLTLDVEERDRLLARLRRKVPA